MPRTASAAYMDLGICGMLHSSDSYTGLGTGPSISKLLRQVQLPRNGLNNCSPVAFDGREMEARIPLGARTSLLEVLLFKVAFAIYHAISAAKWG